MSQLPKDGYYMATVSLDTGGSIREYVQVQGGKVFTKSASELLPEACSDFAELGPIHFVCVFPGQAAIELEDLRAEVARLRKWIADLEVVDHNPGPHRKWADVRHWIPSGCQIFLGDPPPQDLTPTQPDPHSRPS